MDLLLCYYLVLTPRSKFVFKNILAKWLDDTVVVIYIIILCLEVRRFPQSAKLNNLNVHPFEVVSRYREPQFQVAEHYPCIFVIFCLMFEHTFRSQ